MSIQPANSCSTVFQHPAWKGRSDCRNCKIFHEVIFSKLNDEDLDGIINGIYEPIDEFHYAPGSPLYHEGNQDNAIYTIRRGLVKLTRYLPNGSERIIRLMKTGDSIGLERTLDRPYGHTAIAINDVEACRIPIGTLQQLDEEKPRFYRQLMERWATGLFQADDYITMLLSGSVRQRVVHLVAWLSSKAEGGQTGEVELLRGKDMAAMLDVTVESISRVLAEMKREGILRQVRARTFEFDPEKLLGFANRAD